MTPRLILTRKHYTCIASAFFVFVIYGSFVPLQTQSLAFTDATDRYARIMSSGVTFDSRSDWAANVLLFIPLGFLAMGAIAVDRSRLIWSGVLIVAMCALSAAIEFGQLWFPARNTSPNDVVAETIGGVIGVAAWCWFGQSLTMRVREFWNSIGEGESVVRILIAYFLFLVFVHGMPFDLSLSPYAVWYKYKRSSQPETKDIATGIPMIAIAPHPQFAGEKTLLNIAYFLPAGVLLANLPGRRWRNPGQLTFPFMAAFGIAIAIEGLQVMVVSCSAYATDIITDTICVLSGWWLMVHRDRLPNWLAPVSFFGWVLALLLVHLAPFDLDANQLENRLNLVEWIPFSDYFASNYLGAFNSIINKLMHFVPLGFLCIAFTKRSITTTTLIATAIAIAIEVGQTCMASRQVWHSEIHRLTVEPKVGSISDVILGFLGALTGSVIGHRFTKLSNNQNEVVDQHLGYQY